MAVSWTILSATVNAEGNAVTLRFQVDGTSTDLPAAPVPSGITFDKDQLFDIYGWRFDAETLQLRKETTPKQLESADRGTEASGIKFEVDTPTSGNNRLTFTATIHLADKGRVAINASTGTELPRISKLGAEWCTVVSSWQSPKSPQLLDVALTTSGIGAVPTSDLKMRADAHAESVDRDGALTADLDRWDNLVDPDMPLADASGDGPDLSSGEQAVPVITYDGGDEDAMETPTAFSSITTNALIAAVFAPVGETSVEHIVGKYNITPVWRVYVDDSSPRKIVYETKDSGGNSTIITFTAHSLDTTILFVLARVTLGQTVAHSAWINGRPVTGTGSLSTSIRTDGTGGVTIGARQVDSDTWGTFLTGDINQVILYDNTRPDLNLALIMHQMATMSGVILGTPLPTNYTEPQYLKSGAKYTLDRKPIARINLYGANHDENLFGQNSNWRPNPMSQSAIEDFLRTQIRAILNACDDFEIMFNRPGGTYREDIVPTYIWGSGTDPQTGNPVQQVTNAQWGALIAMFDEFGLHDHNNRGVIRPQPTESFARRAWFYTGGGLPLKQSGASIGELETDGHMYNRVVGPVTASSYKAILDNWTNANGDPPRGDPRFRCLHCDAMSKVYGLFTLLCNEQDIYDNYLLVGEAIPQDENARKGAVWYGSLEFPKAPWWVFNTVKGHPDKSLGYDTQWTTTWDTQPIYFGVERGEYPYLYSPRDLPDTPAGDGSNMSIGDIYRFILKGATPVAVSPQVRRKVGAAWDYAMKRIPLNAWDRTGRMCRVQR